jgi:hypothetical protein
MYPNWVLIFDIIVGIVGIFIGIRLIFNKLKLKFVLFAEFLILSVGLWAAG